MSAHKFEAISTAAAFILAGNARFTLVSGVTGARFTFRVSRKDESSPWFVSVLSGANNEADYAYLGTIFPARPVHGRTAPSPMVPVFFHGKKSRIGKDAPSAKAFAWAWTFIARGQMPPSCEIWHEGRCGKCGRALTVPESIASGIGPVCEDTIAA